MKKVQPRRLAVQRESIRNLDADRLKHIVAGYSESGNTCTHTTHTKEQPDPE